jgi:hypothetical protein
LIVFPVICPPGPVLPAIARLGPEPKVRTPGVNILRRILALLMKSIYGVLSAVLKIELLGTIVIGMKIIS